jgi:hypothetical protein
VDRQRLLMAGGSGAALVLAVVLTLLLTGVIGPGAARLLGRGEVAGVPAGRPNGAQNMEPDEVWQAVRAAIRGASSVRVTGSDVNFVPDTARWTIDVRSTRAGDQYGRFTRSNGERVEILRVHGSIWARGPVLWTTYGPAAARRIGDQWVRIPRTLLRETDGTRLASDAGAELTDENNVMTPEALVRSWISDFMDPFDGIVGLADAKNGLLGTGTKRPVPLRRHPGLTVSGELPAVTVEQSSLYLLVAATGPAYPLEYSTVPQSFNYSVDWHFGEWNAPARIAPPAASVDLERVKP